VAIKKYSEKEIEEFTIEYEYAYKNTDKKNIFNMDEIFWNILNIPLYTMGIVGSESVKLAINGSDKEGFTVALIVSANGDFLKPIIIAKGKTKLSLRKFELDENTIGTFSNNGWMNAGIMQIVLNTISSITNNENSMLIMDQHPSHINEFVKKEAKKKNIKLIHIPIGMTSKYQPLDIKINGIIKSCARKLYRIEKINNLDKKFKISDSIRHLIESIKIVDKKTIINSFTTFI